MDIIMEVFVIGSVIVLLFAFLSSLFENKADNQKSISSKDKSDFNKLIDKEENKIELNQEIDEDESSGDNYKDFRVQNKTIVYYERYDGSFVFVDKIYAKDITRFVNALESAKNWSEFKRKAPSWYEPLKSHLNGWYDNYIDENEIKLKGKFSGIKELIMSEDESGDARLIPDLYDEMSIDIWNWVPEDIINQYADYGDAPSGANWMNIDNEEILDEIKALGYHLEYYSDGNYNFGNQANQKQYGNIEDDYDPLSGPYT